MLAKNLQKWTAHTFSSSIDTGKDYLTFQRAMKADLKRQAEENGLELSCFNKGHYSFSAVLKNPVNNKFAYVSIMDVRTRKWEASTMYRTMKFENDWTGGPNQWDKWDEVGKSVKHLIER